MKDFETTDNGRRVFPRTVVLGWATVGAATTMFSDAEHVNLGVPKASAKGNAKMAFVQWQPQRAFD